MRAANGGEVGKILHHRCVLTTKGQIDEVSHVKIAAADSHTLKLCELAPVKAVQPFDEIVQLVDVHGSLFKTLDDRNVTADRSSIAVTLRSAADTDGLQICVYIFRDGEADCHGR
ncbi:hypothetical protein SDC9_74004 [bioreactor metagenome]|uniref:Uncharacterized protein n=1 Tax=bioreactor metagenome TaxID=1076179 RepID=A0A644YLX8_9ZZZZ